MSDKKNSAIDRAMEKITSIMADREATLASLENSLKQDEAAVSSAAAEMDRATLAGDLDTYRQAKQAKAEAEDALEMHSAQRVTLQSKALISEGEYSKLVSDICSEFAALEETTKQTAAKLADEMADAGLKLKEAQASANKVLHTLQHDIYRDADRTRNSKTGEIITINHEAKEVDAWETINWTYAACLHYGYKNYTGHDCSMQMGAGMQSYSASTAVPVTRLQAEAVNAAFDKAERDMKIEAGFREVSSLLSTLE